MKHWGTLYPLPFLELAWDIHNTAPSGTCLCLQILAANRSSVLKRNQQG